MAVIKAQATGNWSATGTWSGGVVPTLNDTVYANGFTVTLDQSIDLTGSTVDTSGSFIPGQIYQIVSLGTTNFSLTANCIAPGSNAGTAVAVANTVGTYFQAVNAGTATTGTARRVGALLTFVNTPLTIATGGGFALSSNYNVTGAYIMAGSTAALTVSGTASTTLTGCRSVGSAFTGSTRSILFSSSGTLSGVGLIIAGGNASGAYGLGNTGAGTVELTSSSLINGGTFNSDSWGAINSSTGIIQITSGTIAPSSTSGGIRNTSTGQIICSGVSTSGGYLESIKNEGNGSVTFSSGSVNASSLGGISNSGASGSVTVNNSTISGSVNAATAYGVTNTSGGTITTTGCTITGAPTGGGYGIYNGSIGTLVLNSSTINANAVAGVFNNSTGSVTSSGDITATNSAFGLSSTNASATVIVSGSLISAPNGTVAVYSPKFRMSPAPAASKTRYAASGIGTYLDMYTSDNTSGITGVATTDVRLGVSYGGGLVGTCAVPNAGTVAFGVAVDNTTGTATLTAANVRAALGMASANLDTQLAALPTAASNATAVWGAAARTITGGTVTTLTNAPASVTPSDIWSHASRTLTSASGPSASDIRQEMDANSTKLANLDAAVSSRLAASAYTAPPTPPTAAQVRAEMDSNSTKLANLDATVSSRLATSGYTAPSAAPTVTAIRQEMDSNSTKLANLDATVSSRLATSGYTAPITPPSVTAIRQELDTNSTKLANLDATVSSRLASSVSTNITAIKAKTDLLNTDRLAQCATTSIVGNLIAQSNS